jgi:hypothetical protein
MPTLTRTKRLTGFVDTADEIEFAEPAISDAECDQALGSFLRAWNSLELNLTTLMGKLALTDDLRTQILAQSIPQANQRDLIIALGVATISQEDMRRLRPLIEEVKTATGIRNKLVHGTWRLVLQRKKKTDPFEASWVRTVKLVEPNLLSPNANQESSQRTKVQQAKNQYTFEQILKSTADVYQLAKKVEQFMSRLNLK